MLDVDVVRIQENTEWLNHVKILRMDAEIDWLIDAIQVILHIRTGYHISEINLVRRYLIEQWAHYVASANAVAPLLQG